MATRSYGELFVLLLLVIASTVRRTLCGCRLNLLTLSDYFAKKFIYVLYSAFFSPLSKFPGPFWSKVSPFWLVKQSRATRRTDAVMSLHKQYGNFVRIAPNHVSINVSHAANEVYGHKTGFLKAGFYDAFVQIKPGRFNTREVDIHQRGST